MIRGDLPIVWLPGAGALACCMRGPGPVAPRVRLPLGALLGRDALVLVGERRF